MGVLKDEAVQRKKQPRHQAEKPAPSHESAETGNVEATSKEFGQCKVEEARANVSAVSSFAYVVLIKVTIAG